MRVQENREPEPKKNKLKKQSFVSLFEHARGKQPEATHSTSRMRNKSKKRI